ncbi:hypothetical protein G6F40_015867 [Rhizopus arrhizus]|nr:hypothetical protein G6F40_015867 [Rhizopus arrhizus]
MTRGPVTMAGPLFFLDGCSAEYDRFVDGPVRGLAPVLAAAPAHRIEGRAVAAAGGCGRAAAHRRHLLGHDGLAGDTEAGDRHAGHRLDGGAAAGAGATLPRRAWISWPADTGKHIAKLVPRHVPSSSWSDIQPEQGGFMQRST